MPTFTRLITTTMYTGNLKKGDILEMQRNDPFGKEEFEVTKVVWIFQQWSARYALLNNGMKLFVLPPLSSSDQE